MQVHREWICFKNVLQMTATSVYNSTKQREKKAWLCLGPCHKQENLTITRSNLLSTIKAAKCLSLDHTTQRKHWWSLTLVFRREGNWRTTSMWFQASWSARLYHGGVMFSKRRPQQCEHKTNDCWATQSRPMKQSNHVNQDFGTDVLQESWWWVCTTRPHCANIVMIVAGTSSQTRRLHVKPNPCANNPLHILVEWCSHGTRQRNRNDDNNWNLLADRKSHNVNEDAWTSARLKD